MLNFGKFAALAIRAPKPGSVIRCQAMKRTPSGVLFLCGDHFRCAVPTSALPMYVSGDSCNRRCFSASGIFSVAMKAAARRGDAALAARQFLQLVVAFSML